MVPVPSNWTKYYQTLDLTVNKSCIEAQSCYSNEINKHMLQGKNSHENNIDFRVTIVKPVHAKWIVKFYDYIKYKSDTAKNVWLKSDIIEKLKENINLDPFLDL